MQKGLRASDEGKAQGPGLAFTTIAGPKGDAGTEHRARTLENVFPRPPRAASGLVFPCAGSGRGLITFSAWIHPVGRIGMQLGLAQLHCAFSISSHCDHRALRTGKPPEGTVRFIGVGGKLAGPRFIEPHRCAGQPRARP